MGLTRWQDMLTSMANSIKEVQGSPALQITKPARSAGLVEEDDEGETRYRADVHLHAVDDLVLVIDRDRVDMEDRAELVRAAIRYQESTHQSRRAKILHKGNGYMVTLGDLATDAGFEVGDPAPTSPAPGLILINRKNVSGLTEPIDGLVGLRQEQAE